MLVLDSLEDPQNFGSLLRTAEASGVHGVVYPTRRQAPLSPAAIKASAGAVEHLLLVPVDDLAEALTDLHVRGLRIVGSDADAPLTARQADLRGPVADRRRQRRPGSRAGRSTSLRLGRPHPDARPRRVAQRRGRGLDPSI